MAICHEQRLSNVLSLIFVWTFPLMFLASPSVEPKKYPKSQHTTRREFQADESRSDIGSSFKRVDQLETGIDDSFKGARNIHQTDNDNIRTWRGLGLPDDTKTFNKNKSIDEESSEMLKENKILVTSKSAQYTQIYIELPNLAEPIYRETLFCKDRCGLSMDCSCKPTCLFFKTCCVDFEESCGEVYDIDLFLEEYNWLRSASVECVDYTVVVASCRNDSDYQNVSHQSFDIREGSWGPYVSKDLIQDETKKTSADVSLMGALEFLLSLSQEEKRDLDEAEKLLLTTPILDSSTGISYKNLSLYECNEANLSKAVPWSIDLFFDGIYVLPSSKIKSVQDLLILTKIDNMSYLNDEITVRSVNRYLPTDIYVEQCIANAVKSCPENYTDNSIENACENINFFTEITRKAGSSIFYEYYKNPFCVICNMGMDRDLQKIQFSPAPLPHCPRCMTHKRVAIEFNVNQEGGRSFDMIQRSHAHAISFAWFRLTCGYVITLKALNKDTKNNTNASTGLRKQFNKTGSKFLTTQCRLAYCNKIEGKCQFINTFVVCFPPSPKLLGNNFLADILDKLKRFLIENVPGALNRSINNNISSTYFLTSLNAKDYVGNQFQYFFHVALPGKTGGNKHKMMSLIRDSAITFLQGLEFPHKKGKGHVCFSINYQYFSEDRLFSDAILDCSGIFLLRDVLKPYTDDTDDANLATSPAEKDAWIIADFVLFSFLYLLLG